MRGLPLTLQRKNPQHSVNGAVGSPAAEKDFSVMLPVERLSQTEVIKASV